MVPTPRDLVDCHFWQQLLQILALGIVFFLHCGTPCNTFTSARKLDGGPPPLRSAERPLGLDGLRWEDQMLVFLGNFIFGKDSGSMLARFCFWRGLHDRESPPQFALGHAPAS